MKKIEVNIHGITGLLMNSNKGVNPLNKTTQQIKVLTAKRKRTEDDEVEIYRLKWINALYYDEVNGVHVPSVNIEAMIKSAAKTLRKGSIAKQSSAIIVQPDFVPLIYPGPKKPEELWNDPEGRYADIRVGRIKQASINLCRPRFNQWDLKFTVRYDETKFDYDELVNLIALAGHEIGLCDYREKYGHFDIVEVKKLS